MLSFLVYIFVYWDLSAAVSAGIVPKADERKSYQNTATGPRGGKLLAVLLSLCMAEAHMPPDLLLYNERSESICLKGEE